ncbi:TetR family transcriptional regulator [Streptomyces coeruleorubidus]
MAESVCFEGAINTRANGIAVQAAGGATREDLQQVADMALRGWPPA